jgi:hypothetical protein
MPPVGAAEMGQHMCTDVHGRKLLPGRSSMAITGSGARVRQAWMQPRLAGLKAMEAVQLP